MARLMIALLAIGLTGCVTPPTRQQLAAADYGPQPAQYQQLFASGMGSILKDPYSAQYQVVPPMNGWRAAGREVEYGWYVCGLVNAKNSYGGYAGNTPGWIFVRYGQVRSVYLDKYASCPPLSNPAR